MSRVATVPTREEIRDLWKDLTKDRMVVFTADSVLGIRRYSPSWKKRWTLFRSLVRRRSLLKHERIHYSGDGHIEFEERR